MSEVKGANEATNVVTGDNRVSLLTLLPDVQDLYSDDTTDNSQSLLLRKRLQCQGFYEAIAQIECPENRLREILGNHKELCDARQSSCDVSYEAVKTDYENRIADIDKEIADINGAMNIDDQSLEALYAERVLLQGELAAIKGKLYDIRDNLAKQKQQLLDELHQETRDTVEETMELQKITYDKEYGLANAQFKNSEVQLKKRATVLSNLQQQYTERMESVHDRLNVLAGEGVNPYATFFLMSVGMAAIGAAGILYSTFTYTAKFGNQDFFNFLFSGFIQGSRNGAINFWVKLAALIGTLSLITVVAWLCHWVLEKLKGPDKKNDRYSGRERWRYKYQSDRLSVQIISKNWYVFWLRILPLLLLIGLVILLLSFNNTALDADRLSSSTEGILLGSAMALGLTGVVYLYIVKIIEPRLMRMRNMGNDKQRISWAKLNWELVICIGVFIACCVAIIFFYIQQTTGNDMSSKNKVAISILKFVAISLVGAISFAYGVRCRGLMALFEYLKREMTDVQQEIEDCSGPLITTDFAEPVGKLITGILTRLEDKASYHISPAYTSARIYYNEPQVSNKKNAWWLFGSKPVVQEKNTVGLERVAWVTEWEARYFPELNELIIRASGEYEEKKASLKQVQEKIDAEENNRRRDSEERSNLLKALRNKQANLRENILRLDIRWERLRQQMTDMWQQERLWLKEGFHLGIWYRENQLGPTDNYYLSSKNSNNGNAADTTHSQPGV